MTEKQEILRYINEFKNKDREGIKQTYIRLMQTLKNSKTFSLDEYERKASLIRECYDMFCSHKIRSNIPNMTNSEIYDMFSEMKLDDKKRKYDMSELFDESLIATKDNQGFARRAVVEVEKEGQETAILDSMGRCITITPIGAIGYDNAFKTRKDLTKYLIQKETSRGQIEEHIVYSEIDFLQLSCNEEYRKVVADELLSDRNIKLSKANGYIGKIEQAKGELYEEKSTSQGYTYQASKNYGLNYDADELSAVGIVANSLLFPNQKPLDKKVLSPEELKNMYGITIDGER